MKLVSKKETQLKKRDEIHLSKIKAMAQTLEERKKQLDQANRALQPEQQEVGCLQINLQAKKLKCIQSEVELEEMKDTLNKFRMQLEDFERIKIVWK